MVPGEEEIAVNSIVFLVLLLIYSFGADFDVLNR